MHKAVIYFGHGARDAVWRAPFDALVARSQFGEQTLVLSAFLEKTEPSLEQALQQCVAQGVRQVKVVPIFVGMGSHLREDLPKLLAAQRWPQLTIEVLPPIGEWPEVLDAVVAKAR